MAIEPDKIRYSFEVDGRRLQFEVGINKGDTTPAETSDLPGWTELGHKQCPCCPLKTESNSHCPAAADLHKALEAFHELESVGRARVTVETARRSYVRECDLQTGLNSMIGVIMATSGCPVVSQLKNMATFHLPFSSFAETLYRTVGAYLTKQYFIQQEGGEADWQLEGLKRFYEELETLNQAFSSRLQAIEQSDAISNAMVMFFSTSIVAASAVEDQLEEYKDYFTGESLESPDA